VDSHDRLSETDAMDVGASLGVDRSWKRDGVGVTMGLHYIDLYRVNTDTGEVDEDQDQINTSLEIAWRRDLSEDWSSVLGAGVTTIVPFAEGLEVVTSPTVTGTIAYFPVWGTFRLTAQRIVAPNLFVAENTITDDVSLNAWLPIPLFVDDPLEPILTGSAGLSARRSQLVDLETDDRESANSYIAALGLHYSPQRSEFGVSLLYTFFHQDEDPSVTEPRFDTFTRNTIMLSVHGRWPEETAALFPHRDVLRVDETDRTPIGGEGDASQGPAQPAD
jgi:hypothetical protein